MSSTTRRIAAAIGTACTSAVLAAMLTTGTAVAAQPGPNSAACEAAKARVTELQGDLTAAKRAAEEIRTEAAASNEAAVDPDTTQTDPEGDPTGPDGAADAAEGPPLDTDEAPVGVADPEFDPEGNSSGLDGARDQSEGSPLDTNEPAVDPDGADGISPAEQREIDRADRVVNRVQRNLDNAEARRDKVCATPTTNPSTPAATPATSVVVCVLKPGTCAEVRVDSQGRLVEIVREIKCDTGQLPAATGTRKGEKVTVVNRQVIERHVTSDPGSGSGSTTTYLPSDPGSSSTYSGGQVTQIPSGSVDTGDGSYRVS